MVRPIATRSPIPPIPKGNRQPFNQRNHRPIHSSRCQSHLPKSISQVNRPRYQSGQGRTGLTRPATASYQGNRSFASTGWVAAIEPRPRTSQEAKAESVLTTARPPQAPGRRPGGGASLPTLQA